MLFRSQEMLEAMKAQGIELPTETTIDKKPRLGTRVRTKKGSTTEAAASSTQEASQGEQELNEEDAKEEEQLLEAQASAEEEDVKDEWDATSSEEEDNSKENSSPVPPHKDVPRKANAPLSQGNNVNRKLRHSSSENGGKGESVEDSDSEDSSDESEHTLESKREKALRRIQVNIYCLECISVEQRKRIPLNKLCICRFRKGQKKMSVIGPCKTFDLLSSVCLDMWTQVNRQMPTSLWVDIRST